MSPPVHQLRLYRSEDQRGTEIFGIAPNPDVEEALFMNTLLPTTQTAHRFIIADVTDRLPDDRNGNLAKLLEAGPAGIAEFDEENEGWWA